MIDQRPTSTSLPPHLGRNGGALPPPSPPLDPPATPPAGTAGYATATGAPAPPPPAEPPAAGGPRGWARFLAVLAAAVVAIVAAFGVGRITAPDTTVIREAAPAARAIAPATPADPAPGADPVVPGSASGSPDVVADVAAAVGPAVVQLETGFGVGSGVIYDSDGYILTAAHVVGSRGSVDVRLADGRLVEGTVVGTNDRTDVAVVEIAGSPDLPTAALAIGEPVRVGQLAIALGSPFGLDQTVTAGIVSAVDRDLNGVIFVQTDAAINPGNSGGPLVDSQGRVIGINDQIFTQGGGNDGVGFAISIDLAKIVADQLVAGETVQLAFLGVSTTDSAATAGVVVDEVIAGSAAEAAGLEVGDTITAIDGRPVQDIGDLRVRIITTSPGTSVSLDVLRNGQPLEVTATLGAAD